MTAWLQPSELYDLVERHKAALEIYAAQWSDAAEDCVQEAFVQLVQQSHRPDRPMAWLFRVTRNLAISDARSSQRRRKREQQAAELGRRIETDGPLASLALAEALTDLEDDLRQIVIARIWGGLTFQEIADVTDLSVATAHRYYAEALALLKKKLGTPCLR